MKGVQAVYHARQLRWLFVAVAAVVFGGAAQAASLHVPTEFPSIQAAVNAAADNDVIELAPGVYFETGVFVTPGSANGLTIRGATGDRDDVVLNGGGQGGLIELQRSGSIEAITFVNAYRGYGGAIALSAQTGPINCEITNCRFVGCRACDGGAGALAASVGHLIIRDCVFESNVAVGGGNTIAGAVRIAATSYEIDNCQFLYNVAQSRGGALSVDGGSGTITNCLFQGNTATGSQARGGAIFFTPGTANLLNCSFVLNQADLGASLAIDHCTLTATNCDIDTAGYISGNALVTMVCCTLGNMGGWNIQPILRNDGCVVAVTATTWGAVKSMFR